MISTNSIEALEELNKQYLSLLHSPQYRLGQRLLLLKQMGFKKWWKWLNARRIEKQTRQLSSTPTKVWYEPGSYPATGITEKGIVYSCITQGYDLPKSPILQNPRVTYKLFTDAVEMDGSVVPWNIASLPPQAAAQHGRYCNRYCKMHPAQLFTQERFSVYIDGNVRVVSDVAKLFNVAAQAKTGLALHLHSKRNCVYKEAQACCLYRRGDVENIRKFVKRLRAEKFPEQFGLLEATIIVADLHNPASRSIMQAWWNELVCSATERDQLILPYVLWKLGYTLKDVGLLGNNEYWNPMFQILGHQ